MAALAMAPGAHAASIYIYNLSSAAGFLGNGVSGSIAIEGNQGDALPALDSASIVSWQFNVDAPLVQWESSTAQILANSMFFDGSLGDATLHGTSGVWEVSSPQSNIPLYLFGQPDTSRYDETWGWCFPNSTTCGDYGDNWILTLASATPETPEPSTAALLLGAAAAFGVARARRTKRV